MQRCPNCDSLISAQDINIQEGFALCPACGGLTKLSMLNHSGRTIQETLVQPPSGCSIVAEGERVVVRGSLKSIPKFLFFAGFALFWNGSLSIFLMIALAGLYSNLIGPLPEWFPAPKENGGKPEMNGAPMDLGMTLFLCLFLVPFVIAGISVLTIALMNIIGKVVVVIDEFDSYAATGFSFLLWKKRFKASQVNDVTFGTKTWQSDGETKANRFIELRSERKIQFGSLLEAERLEWMCVALKELLLKDNTKRTMPDLPKLTWLRRDEK